ncbi:kinase-like domain-containing protein [Xylaria sp. FL1042]|nr:kinase-like domain-containing protein [Xylaria sp. FL1042]
MTHLDEDHRLFDQEAANEPEGIEDLEEYCEDGLHPVDILDILDGRFEVCHKLGSGGIATVWLCYEAAQKRWRAVKINAASRSSGDSAELIIDRIFKEQAVTTRHLDMHHIAIAEETFWIEGPNGKHLCSVLPVLGPNLQHWRHMSMGLSATRINKVCYEITEGLQFLHEHGICHADFRPQNILMRLADGGLDHLDPDDLFRLISLPRQHKVQTLNGEHSPNAPKWVVEPLRWFELKSLVSDSAVIVDFGEAFEVTSIPEYLGIPRTYASPEITYGEEPVGTESDVWSLALTLMEARTGLRLGEIPSSPLNRMESFAGPIPPPYRSLAAEELYHDELPSQAEGESCQDAQDSSPDGIEEILGQELREKVLVPKEGNIGREETATKMIPYRIPENELAILADLLRRMLKYKPSDRLSTSSVLEHPWFKIGMKSGQINTEEPFKQVLRSKSRESRPADKEPEKSKSKRNTNDQVDARIGRPQALLSILPGQMVLCSSILIPVLISSIILWSYR